MKRIGVDVFPYGGLRKVGRNRYAFAKTAPSLFVSGETGSGKTTRVLGPGLVNHAALRLGAQIGVSMKQDFLDLVAEVLREMGVQIQVADMRKETGYAYPGGAVEVEYDPTRLIRSTADALHAAQTLLALVSMGYGGTGSSGGGDTTWLKLAEQPLAAFFYAARKMGHEGGISWLTAALRKFDVDPETEDPATTPSWMLAEALCEDEPMFSGALQQTREMEPEQRDSVRISMTSAIEPFTNQILKRRDLPEPLPVFDPAFLDNPKSALFIIAPKEGSTGAACALLLESLIALWKTKVEKGEDPDILGMFIDEIMNCAPLPNLGEHVSTIRSLRIYILAALQNTGQLKKRYGEQEGESIRKEIPAYLFLKGAKEDQIYQEMAEASSRTDIRTASIHRTSGDTTLSSQRDKLVDWGELRPESLDYGRLTQGGNLGSLVYLPWWDTFLALREQGIEPFTSKSKTKGVPAWARWWQGAGLAAATVAVCVAFLAHTARPAFLSAVALFKPPAVVDGSTVSAVRWCRDGDEPSAKIVVYRDNGHGTLEPYSYCVAGSEAWYRKTLAEAGKANLWPSRRPIWTDDQPPPTNDSTNITLRVKLVPNTTQAGPIPAVLATAPE